MATVDWSREPAELPPATFTLSLSEDEARTIARVLYSDNPDRAEERQQTRIVYEVVEDLAHAFEAAGLELGVD